MKVTQKKNADGTLQLDAVASTAEVSKALNASHLMFAQQMGLRPEQGKTVAQVAAERMNIRDLDAVVEAQAVDYLAPFAIDKKDISPAFPPQPKPTSPLKRGSTFSFTLTVTPKPDYELTSYDPVEVAIPAFAADTTEVDKQLEDMADRYAEFVTDEPHVIKKGDSCLLQLESKMNGAPMPALTFDARPYTAGAGLMPDGFDEAIIGMDVGETKTFSFEGPSVDEQGNEITDTIECTATVKEAQKKQAPQLTDEWVAKMMPMYKDLAGLRKSIEDRVLGDQRKQYDDYRLQRVADEAAKRFQGSIPDEVYEAMSASLISDLRKQLSQQGTSFDDFVEQQGGKQQFNMMTMMQTRQMLVQGYTLDAVFRHEKLVVTDEDLDDVCRMMNPQNPKAVRQQMEEAGRGFALRETAERVRANKWLADHAIITEPEEAQA